jgi:GNAT superfamily N-acetyltransferase
MPSFRFAEREDVAALLPLMRDFYEYERLAFDIARTERMLNELIADERLGRVILFEDAGAGHGTAGAAQGEAQDTAETSGVPGGALVGYMVLTFGYSLEFGGRDALIDEFYVVPSARGTGIGTRAVAHAVEICRAVGVRNMHLEADYFNSRVHDFYKRLGFRDHERHLMTLSI